MKHHACSGRARAVNRDHQDGPAALGKETAVGDRVALDYGFQIADVRFPGRT